MISKREMLFHSVSAHGMMNLDLCPVDKLC